MDKDLYFNNKSMYDVIMENLERQKKGTYIHRMLYCFEYDVKACVVDLGKKFKEIIDYQHSHYHDERTTGILVLYDNIGFHLVEGSDDSLSRHSNLIYREGNLKTWMPNVVVKLFVTVFHVKNRLQKNWSCVHVQSTPPSEELLQLLSKKEPDIAELYDKFIEILVDPQSVVNYVCKDKEIQNVDDSSSSSTESLQTCGTDGANTDDGITEIDQVIVPPTQLLSAIIQSNFLNDLEFFSDRIRALPRFLPYYEIKWPMPLSMIPEYEEVMSKDDQVDLLISKLQPAQQKK